MDAAPNSLETAPYVYEYAVPLAFPAAQEAAFRALIDEAALKTWFADHVVVDPKVGGPYRFWGKSTPDTRNEAQATQKVTAIAPDSSLSFSWRVLGHDSTVTWSVAKESDATSKITVRHEFPKLPEGVRAKEMIDDLWRLNTGNLFLFLMGDDRIFRPDLSDPHPVVKLDIVINAVPAKVFAALIEPDQIRKWFPAPAPVVDPKVGGDYGFGFSFEMEGKKIEVPPMKILEFEKDKRLAITWPDWRMDPKVPNQKVTWTLVAMPGGKTKLTLVHDGFIRAVDVSDYPFGWIEFMEKIGKVSEGSL